VLRALEQPIRQIAENAGVEGSIVVGTRLPLRSLATGLFELMVASPDIAGVLSASAL
jgi:hypothetical protein